MLIGETDRMLGVTYNGYQQVWHRAVYSGLYDCILSIFKYKINNNNNQYLYSAFSRRSKRRPLNFTSAIRKSTQSFRLNQACCEAVPCTAYQHLDCNIPSNSVPNIALVNEARKVKWIAQAHNTLAVAGLKLTTFGLWGLQVSTRPHQMHLSAQQCQYTLTRWCCYHTYCTRI